MFTVLVSLTVKPDKLDEFLHAIDINSAATLRDEPGCLRFDVHRVADDPHRFVLYEIYRDEAAFYDEHRAAPHYTAFRAASAECIADGGHVNTFATPVFPDRIPEATEVRP